MSKHNDLIMELLDEILSGVTPHEEEERPHEEPPTETKGFESLVSAEEYEAIKELKKALDKYIDVHNKNVMSSIRKIGSFTPYARIQYSILSDVINEVIKSVAIMQGIHIFNKEFIDFSKGLFVPKLCKHYRPKTKGKVERFNHYLKNKIQI